MKKVIIAAVSALLTFSAANVSAQAFEEGTKVVAVGYGWPNLGKTLLTAAEGDGEYNAFGFGPIHARFEYGLTDRFGIGLSFNMNSFGAEWTDVTEVYNSTTQQYESRTYNYKESMNAWNMLIRFNRHWDVSDEVDVFSGIGLGYSSRTWKSESNDPDWQSDDLGNLIPIGFEWTVGVRYFFTDNIGAYIEAGWSKSILQGGLCMKF